MGNFRTVFQSASAEEMIEKSRFIAYVKPIATEAEAIEFIEHTKKKHWDAAHNVPVYVLGEKYAVQRYSDDGEPSGTAGVPILSMLKNEGITDVVVVVTRYFGGIKLGTGGLVRAYTHTAKLGLEAALLIEKVIYEHISIQLDYHLHGKAQNYLLGVEDLIIEDTQFSDRVAMELYVLPERIEEVVSKLTDITSGQLTVLRLGESYLSIHQGEILEKIQIEP